MAQALIVAYIYAYISSAWVLLDDVQPWEASWGISGNGPLDFLADTGELQFSLNNSGGLYTPGGPSALAGFKRGVPVKVVVTFDGEDYERFRGYIDEIKISPSNIDKTVQVTALDWMDYAARHPVTGNGVLTTPYSDEVMQTVLADLEIPPQQTDLAPGVFTVKTALDIAGTKTTAYTEFARIALNEIAAVYLKHGEILTLENYDTRTGWVEPSEIPLPTADSGLLLKEDGDQLLLETGDGILLNETAAVTLDSSVLSDFDATYGEGVVNLVKHIVYPRRESASPEILFQLDSPMEIGVRVDERTPPAQGEITGHSNYITRVREAKTFILSGTWADPQGGSVIAAKDLITPVITTDYLLNSEEDGSGTNMSSSLVVDFIPDAKGFTAILTNTNLTFSLGYLTKFNVRGTGIFQYNPVEYTAFNEKSIAQNEAQGVDFQQKYRASPGFGMVYADSVVMEYGTPRTRLNAVTFCANKSTTLMATYLNTDVGDLRHIDIDQLGVDGNYYVQSVSDRYSGGNIWTTWGVKEAPSLQGGLTSIAMEFVRTNRDGVDFGPLLRVSHSSVTERTFAAWINVNTTSGDIKTIIAPHADTGGVWMYAAGEALGFYSNRYNVSPGNWQSTTTFISASTWFHVVVSYDHSNVNNDPTLYINGIPQTLNETDTPAGTLNNEVATHVVIGNIKTLTEDYSEGFDGKIFDARIYDRIITDAEALALYNGGDPDPSLVTDGLIFQAFAVRTDEVADYVDVQLNNTDRVFENIYKSVGKIISAPTGRAAP
jgi:hypothetical protein